MGAYATTAALAAETAARRSADDAASARVSALEAAVRALQPVAPAASMYTNYGSSLGESRNNHRIGADAYARLSYRFRASSSSTLASVRVAQRGNGGARTYSGGTGGMVRCRLESDSGGQPSGTVLAATSWRPGNPAGDWEDWDLHAFGSPASVTAGVLHHLVFDNVDADPVANYISLNAQFYWGARSPRQPTFTDDFAVLYAEPTAWVLQATETPILDIAYGDGSHDGMAYAGCGVGAGSASATYCVISGPSMARQTMTVSGPDLATTGAGVAVKRIRGTGSLAIFLETAGGVLIDSGAVLSSAIPLGLFPTVDDQAHGSGNTWAVVAWSQQRVLSSGQGYRLVLACPADTEYIAMPVQDLSLQGMQSRCFPDGRAEGTSDGGANWMPTYYADVAEQDLMFYLATAP